MAHKASMGQQPLLPVGDARSAIETAISSLTPETCSLEDAFGRFCAEDQIARTSHPSLSVSAMDGYAVRSVDVLNLPAQVSVIDESAAGKPSETLIGAGQAIRIFTGAVIPEGADCIILQEDTKRDGNIITVFDAPEAGRYIRQAGQDFTIGATLISDGKRLNARDIGLLASAGIQNLKVRQKPRIAIINSGDELVAHGAIPAAGQLANSNGPMLTSMIKEFGGEPVFVQPIADRAGALDAALEKAGPLDLIVTTGGASVGVHDHIIKDLNTSSQSEVNFWRIAMRPGKPLIFAHWHSVPLLGLPGNPVSAGVCALLFVQAAIAKLQGRLFTPDIITVKIAHDLPENDRREDYLRATLSTDISGITSAHTSLKQDSAMLSLFAAADGLVIRPPFAPALKAGAPISVLKFPKGF